MILRALRDLAIALVAGFVVAWTTVVWAGLVAAVVMLLVVVALEWFRDRKRTAGDLTPFDQIQTPVGYGSVGFRTRIPGGTAEFINTKATGPMAVGYDTEAGRVRYEGAEVEITDEFGPSKRPAEEQKLNSLNQEVVDFWREYGRPETWGADPTSTRTQMREAFEEKIAPQIAGVVDPLVERGLVTPEERASFNNPQTEADLRRIAGDLRKLAWRARS